jgi:histone-lysine N-methyltransferase SETD1
LRLKNLKENECFKQCDYINILKEKKLQLIKKNTGAKDDLSFRSGSLLNKNSNKFNKQCYKNLERTMSTNINETDLPLAMKFRNFKSKMPKVTIGPSAIHRNGLFALQSFQPGEIVIEYVGELITNKIADFRETEYNFKGFGDCYMFRLDKYQIVKILFYFIFILD